MRDMWTAVSDRDYYGEGERPTEDPENEIHSPDWCEPQDETAPPEEEDDECPI